MTDQDEEAESLLRTKEADEIRAKRDELKKEKEASRMPDVVRQTVQANMPVSLSLVGSGRVGSKVRAARY